VVIDVLDTVFYLVLNMSITASAIGLCIVLLRHIKQIPRFGIYVLWSLVFFRLVFPVAFSSEASILNLAGRFIKKVVAIPITLPISGNESVKLSMSNSIGTAQSYFPVIYKNDHLEMVFRTASFVWIVVSATAMLTVIILYFLSSNELRKTEHIKDNIYISNTVQSPMVFGIFRQRIIIPTYLDIDSPELKFALLHEQVHIRRHDNMFRLLGVLTACIHWFNPLVWVFLRLFLNDMELSCDLKAVKPLTNKERVKYAKALVNLGAGQKVFMSAAFSKTKVRARVLNVLNYKRLKVLAVVFSVFFIIVIAIAFMTNPVK
jgi:beta-lactamase regulating signal transducer with metallopeptidase domain